MLKGNNNIMVDIETMGTEFDSAIVSIAAVKFDDTKVNQEFNQSVSLVSSMDVGLSVSAETILWWIKQKNTISDSFSYSKNNIVDVLNNFNDFIGWRPCIWGNGSDFDNVILDNAFKCCGIKKGWTYKGNRCYRTMSKLFPNIEYTPPKESHVAIYDAISQAEHLIKIGEFINGGVK